MIIFLQRTTLYLSLVIYLFLLFALCSAADYDDEKHVASWSRLPPNIKGKIADLILHDTTPGKSLGACKITGLKKLALCSMVNKKGMFIYHSAQSQNPIGQWICEKLRKGKYGTQNGLWESESWDSKTEWDYRYKPKKPWNRTPRLCFTPPDLSKKYPSNKVLWIILEHLGKENPKNPTIIDIYKTLRYLRRLKISSKIIARKVTLSVPNFCQLRKTIILPGKSEPEETHIVPASVICSLKDYFDTFFHKWRFKEFECPSLVSALQKYEYHEYTKNVPHNNHNEFLQTIFDNSNASEKKFPDYFTLRNLLMISSATDLPQKLRSTACCKYLDMLANYFPIRTFITQSDFPLLTFNHRDEAIAAHCEQYIIFIRDLIKNNDFDVIYYMKDKYWPLVVHDIRAKHPITYDFFKETSDKIRRQNQINEQERQFIGSRLTEVSTIVVGEAEYKDLGLQRTYEVFRSYFPTLQQIDAIEEEPCVIL